MMDQRHCWSFVPQVSRSLRRRQQHGASNPANSAISHLGDIQYAKRAVLWPVLRRAFLLLDTRGRTRILLKGMKSYCPNSFMPPNILKPILSPPHRRAEIRSTTSSGDPGQFFPRFPCRMLFNGLAKQPPPHRHHEHMIFLDACSPLRPPTGSEHARFTRISEDYIPSGEGGREVKGASASEFKACPFHVVCRAGCSSCYHRQVTCHRAVATAEGFQGHPHSPDLACSTLDACLRSSFPAAAALTSHSSRGHVLPRSCRRLTLCSVYTMGERRKCKFEDVHPACCCCCGDICNGVVAIVPGSGSGQGGVSGA